MVVVVRRGGVIRGDATGGRTWRRPRLAGGLAGRLAVGSLLSLAFSARMRVRSADFAETAMRWLGARVPAGGVIAVCDIPRTVVPRALTGDFALHALMFTWAAKSAFAYYSGEPATFRLGRRFWEGRCPDLRGADVTVTFGELQRLASLAAADP